ncbi:CHAT domain-containing protein [Cumulibacter manganitolerans]|uniref:CHAT domain-containing protein n=1 Tax=Cumulibacter manganitolerans TaxID=1884992 RepID=UPI001E2D63E9|nr:CHAT domain-containing tetratricopeptide repeat protein [Cumulibacter manganitolerans]
MSISAGELYKRGLQLSNDRRYPAAHRTLTKARALAAEPNLSARIAGTLAMVVSQMGDAVSGEQLCTQALALDGVSAGTASVLAGQLGSLLMNQGRFDEALPWLGRAIDGIVDDPVAVANLRMNRGVLYMQRGDLVASTADLASAAELYRIHGTPAEVAEAEHNLGYVALLRGDLIVALQEMLAARPVIAAISPGNAAIGDMDRAEVLRDAGQVREAEATLAHVAKVFAANRMAHARAEAEFHLARSLLRHDAAAAARTARAAARHFAAVDDQSWRARAEGVALRASLAAGGADDEGRTIPAGRRRWSAGDVERVAAELDGARLRNDAAALRLSHDLWRARRGEAVGRPRPPRKTDSLEVRLLRHEIRVERAVRAGRDRDALRAAAEGLDELEAWRSRFGSLDLQTSLRMHGNGLMMAGLGAAVRAHRPQVLFEWSERARRLTQRHAPLRPARDPQVAEQLAGLRMLRADLAGSDWLADPRAVELADRVREHHWSSSRETQAADLVDLDAVRRALDDDTAMLSYVFSPAGMVCVVSTSSRDVVVDIPDVEGIRRVLPGLRSDLDVSAAVRDSPVAAVIARSLARRLDGLSAAILDGPLSVADASKVVLCVPGLLSGIPWAMLPAMRGRTFTLAASATQWVRGRSAGGSAQARAGFAVGVRVDRGVAEVEQAARSWERPVLIRDADATVERVAELAGMVDVLHVAAHGRHAADNALFSGLELADGALFGYDIDRVRDVPDIVILSACELGRSTVRWGAEAIGMTQAWLHAGVRCVIASPVLVADDDACALLGAIHDGLAAGRPPALALREASERTGIVGPFQCHGDGL